MSKELARRAVACPGWREMPGMRLLGHYGERYPVRLCDYGERVFDTMDVDEMEWWQQAGGKDEMGGGPYPGPYLPDLTDPATLGCLLALVREACGGVVACRCRRVRLDLEAEALVAALEAFNG